MDQNTYLGLMALSEGFGNLSNIGAGRPTQQSQVLPLLMQQKQQEAQKAQAMEALRQSGQLEGNPALAALAGYDPQMMMGQVAQSILNPPAAAKPPSSFREWELAQENPEFGAFLQSRQPQTNVTVGAPNVVLPPNPSRFADKTGEILATEAAETVAAGSAAARNLRSVSRLSELLEASPTGAEGVFKQALGEFGIPTDGLDAIQSAQALINNLVPQQRAPGSGPMSDADLALFKQSLPRIINQPGGNALIIDTIRQIAEYDVKRGQIARQWQLGKIGPEEAAAQFDALANPLDNFRGNLRGYGGPPPGLNPEQWEVMSPEDRALFE